MINKKSQKPIFKLLQKTVNRNSSTCKKKLKNVQFFQLLDSYLLKQCAPPKFVCVRNEKPKIH